MRTIELRKEEINWLEKKRKGENQHLLGYFPKKSWGNSAKEKLYLRQGFRCNGDMKFYLRNEMGVFEGRINNLPSKKSKKVSPKYLEKIKKAFIAYTKKRGYYPSSRIFNHSMEEWLLRIFSGNEWEILRISVQREGRCSNMKQVEETPQGTFTRTVYYGWRDRYDEGPFVHKGWVGLIDFAHDDIYYPQAICYYKLRNIRTREEVEIGSDIGKLL